MYRFTTALAFVLAFTGASWAQGAPPAVWQGERGGILKIYNIDPATKTFTGTFISSPTGPCPGVAYDLAGHVYGGHHVTFQTSRTWTTDCAVTMVWSGQGVKTGTVATRWTASYVAPNGQAIKIRGTETFKRN